MVEHLLMVKNAIEEYRIRGIRPLETEIDRLTGAVIRNPTVWLTSRESDFGKRFWDTMGKLALATSIVVGGIQIGQDTFNAFSRNSASTALQIENINTTTKIYVDGRPRDSASLTSSMPALPPSKKGKS